MRSRSVGGTNRPAGAWAGGGSARRGHGRPARTSSAGARGFGWRRRRGLVGAGFRRRRDNRRGLGFRPRGSRRSPGRPSATARLRRLDRRACPRAGCARPAVGSAPGGGGRLGGLDQARRAQHRRDRLGRLDLLRRHAPSWRRPWRGAGWSANRSPEGSVICRWRATRSTNERATTSSSVLEALFNSMPCSFLRSASTSWLDVSSSSATL